MKLLARLTAAMLAGLIMLLGSQVANAAKENSAIDHKLDINAAQLAGKTASQTEKGVVKTRDIATTTASLKIAAVADSAALALVATQTVSIATTSPVVASMALIESLPVALPAAKAGKATASQIINTLYPDPTSSSFPHKGAEAADPNYKTAAEIIEEFNQKAAEIASETARLIEESSSEEGAQEKTQSRTPKQTSKQAQDPVPGQTAEISEQVPDSVIEEIPVETLPVDSSPASFSSIDSSNMEPSDGKVASLTWPDSEQDPEFSNIASHPATTDSHESAETQANTDLPTTENLQTTVDSQALLDFQSAEDSQAPAGLLTSSDSIALPASASGSTTAPTLYNKIPALEPSLMVKGVPVDDQCLLNEIDKLTGRLVPEKQPLGRRHHLYRWVLKTEDGQRVPLKSNLKLLQEVRNDKLLDGNVTLTGRYISSGFNKDLRYFIIESAVPAVASIASGTSDIASVATATKKVTTSNALPGISKLASTTAVSSGTCKVDDSPLLKK